MNLKGFTSGLTRNADKIGAVLGVVAGSTRGLDDVAAIILEVTKGNVHMPNWEQIANVYVGGGYPQSAIMTYVAGEILDAFNLNMFGLNNLGGALKKGSVSYALASFLLHVAYYSTHASEGSNPTKSNTLEKLYDRTVRQPNVPQGGLVPMDLVPNY